MRASTITPEYANDLEPVVRRCAQRFYGDVFAVHDFVLTHDTYESLLGGRAVEIGVFFHLVKK